MKITQRIAEFNVSMTADPRSPLGFARIQHFRIFDKKLVPQLSSKADEIKTMDIERLLYAPWLPGTGYALFGLGVKSGTSNPAIFIKGNITGDIVADSWGTPANNESTTGTRTSDAFFYYKSFFYGFHGGTSLWSYGDLRGSPTFTDAYQSITYASVAQPVHHPSDDCAYFFADNKVYRLNGSSWDGLVLTLPDNLVITSADALSDYLVIACKSISGVENSTAFVWDRDSSLSTVTQRIDWGKGDLIHIANLNGVLIGVTDFFTSNELGHNFGKIIIKRAAADKAVTIAEYETDAIAAATFTGNKMVIDDKLHFPLHLHRQGAVWEGIWAVDSAGRVTIPLTEEDVSTDGRIQGIYKTGNYFWVMHSADGSINRTDDQNNFTYTSILETNILGTPDVQLQLVGATVGFEPLLSGQSVELLYRKDGDTNWTAMKTVSTVGATSLPVTMDANGKAPVFHAIQYRIQSLGATITSFEYTHEVDDDKAYRIQPRRGLPF